MTVLGGDEQVDRRHLAHAVALAQTAQRRASPNPGVGCVVARGSTVIGSGATRAPGSEHAEIVALDSAPDELTPGSTAYVTLSPCAHHGRTPPCVDALIRAGIARVVIALDDPHPLAAGGIGRLENAGVTVEVDDPSSPIARSVAAQLEGFFCTVSNARPHVTLKIAQCVDGRTSLPQRRWITSAPARRAVHRWRAAADAVLVGIGTVLADNPALTVRNVQSSEPAPRAVVVDSHLRLPHDATVVRSGSIVVTTPLHLPENAAVLAAKGVTVLSVPADELGQVDLPTAMSALGDTGILRVLAEPGPRLAQSMIDAGVVDRLVEHVASCEGSAPNASALTRPSGQEWHLERAGGAGPDVILQWLRLRTLEVENLAETR